MTEITFLSIDIGTSSSKVVLFDGKGVVLASASREYPTYFESNGASEQDADIWWEATAENIREIAARCQEDVKKIAGIGIDSQSSVMLPVSADGKTLSRAYIWNDHKGKAQQEIIEKEIGQEALTRINGNHNDASNVAPKIMYFRDNNPEAYARTRWILNASGFIVYRLTGIASMNVSEGGLTQLVDIRTGEWSDELIKGCGLKKEMLPHIYQSYEVVGKVTEETAAALGIPSGIPVTAGAMDVCACALGTDVVKAGDAFITGGTVTALGVCTDEPIASGVLHVYHHIIPGLWMSVAGVDFGGGNFRWFRDRFMKDYTGGNYYDEMNRLAALAKPGCDGLLFLHSLAGQRCPQWDSNMRGSFVGITPTHGKSEFIRSVMEGNAYGVREIMDIQKARGARFDRIVIAGGISASRLWLEIFATVLDRAITNVKTLQDTAYGNMITAAVAVGYMDSFNCNIEGRQFESVLPVPKDKEIYDKTYQIFTKLYPALTGIYDDIALL